MIAIEVLKLVDRLESLVSSGVRLPMSSRTVVDEQEFLEILDQLRVAAREELTQVKRTSQERDRVLTQSQGEAEDVLASARAQVAQMLEQDEVVKAARAQAEVVLEEARRTADDLRSGADTYAFDTLQGLENELNRLLAGVRKGRTMLERSRSSPDGRSRHDRDGRI